ncbi:membrane protein [Mycobacteroides abscessus subsp. massiliense]|uniref:Membrane protein n=2 Tax=Mycobacteroides abscessus TaxID=36809 RepID=A0A1U5GCR7_9MYCO|nr:hypothetical protein [Mycobacteroides abscessus]SIN21925.1 membrane protein [Mycobacteroides abscessus subsp. bolletii]SKE03453.1 membrane protein [Mycobacteroides abscessus subsp. massiliense]MBE5430970.1 hypothetical protein [Mycobacteroides abscessus]MBE5444226.1 hypothetical protein [Mycobacteroides abscessus]
MTSPQQIRYRTKMFARILGPYLLIAALTVVGRTAHMRTLLSAFTDTNASVWTWVLGAFVLPMGLVVIVLHPWWRGLTSALVSTLGWLTAFKGAALMAFPDIYLSMGHRLVDMMPWWQTVSAAMALVGLYLTVVGWFPPRGNVLRSTSQSLDLPRTA